jgi:hypothetical protein
MNEKMLELLRNQPDKYPKYLEAHFPHIFQQLVEVWDTMGAESFFNELMMSKRVGRRGFPPEATAEIWALQQVHSSSHEAEQKSTDVWVSNSDDSRPIRPEK